MSPRLQCITPKSSNVLFHFRLTEFASELLVPSEWVSAILARADDFGRVVTWIQENAEVSTIASAIRLIGAAAPSHIFAYCDHRGTVLNSGRSVGTLADAPAWNEKLNRSNLENQAADRGEIPDGAACLYWWKYPHEVALTQVDDNRDWREILQDILGDLVESDVERHGVRQSINGVIGATNSRRRGASANELLAALIQRFGSKAADGGIYEKLPFHPEFRDFLIRRVEALHSIGTYICSGWQL